MLKPVSPRPNFPEMEKDILKFWNKNKTFEKTLSKRSHEKSFSFYDGPPFATGLPHYGHLLAGTIKDVIPRYKTMQGYRVDRIWGWDTHGLPIENIVEKELDIKTKLHIKEMGIDKFNEKCREKVLEFAHTWEKIVERTGRWVDMKNAYITMEPEYMESVWWVFKSLWDKDLVYSGHKVMPYCPRCATGLSAFEVGMPGTYQDKQDKAITVKFESSDEPNTFFLAWTTTPWTLPGNLALAVGGNIDYIKVQNEKEIFIIAKDRLEHYQDIIGNNVVETFSGQNLKGKKYKPIFDYYKGEEKAFEVITGDFVTTGDGTGIVHIAPAFGEDDYKVAKENDIAFFMPVNDMGEFEIEVSEWAGESVIKSETNLKIIENLGNKVIKVEDYKHSYPFCWRCDTPLIYKAIDSWFVKMTNLKEQMAKNNNDVHWVPEFVGKGRFANLIEGAPDWNISRNRFWGVPIPIWRCKDCGESQVMGSIKDLEDKTDRKIGDIHLHKIMDLELNCSCGSKAKLTGEVLDVWFDSGSVPYGSIHYPFENKEKFERDFPADFIAEGIDQTRGWFNSLMILGTALFGKSPYKNVAVNGIVLAEDGQKMSKRLKNYPDPTAIMDKYGADAMRFYLLSSPAVKGGDLNFSEKGVDEVIKGLVLKLWNSYSFFVTYALIANFKPENVENKDILDKWVLSRLNNTIKTVTEELDNYELPIAARAIGDFIDDLSNWYIRRNRKRFAARDKEALNTLYEVLVKLCQLLAPYMPFVTEEIYQNLVLNLDSKANESIHLSDFPLASKDVIDNKLEEDMDVLRKFVEMGLSIRDRSKIKVRQPLSKVWATYGKDPIVKDMQRILLEELNIKLCSSDNKSYVRKSAESLNYKKGLDIVIDINITKELESEGLARELLRKIQVLRKEIGLSIEDEIILSYETDDEDLVKATNHKVFIDGAKVKLLKESDLADEGKNLTVNDKKIKVEIKKA